MQQAFDVFVAGAGTAGIAAAGFAARRGAKVLLVDAADKVGGTLHLSGGNMSAGGTRLQRQRGIADSADGHFADIMRISKNTAEPAMVRLAVDHAADTLHWLLDLGLELLPEMPVITYGHEPYSVPRTYWGPDLGRSILKVMEPWLQRSIDSGDIELRLETKIIGLKQDSRRNVTAAVVRGPDGLHREVVADNYVLATGGYTANTQLYPMLNNGQPLYALGYDHSQGEGIVLGVGAGGYVKGGEMFLPTFGGVRDMDRPGYYKGNVCLTTPQYRMPWEIYVNMEGERFVCEDTDSVDARERSLLRQTNMMFWIVFDQAIYDRAPLLSREWPRAKFDAAFDNHPNFFRAPSLRELANKAGVDAEALQRTVAVYNAGTRSGKDPLGRKHKPLPIEQAPFYAIQNHGTSVKTYAGLAVDTELRVVDREGKPIGNLYAAGEVIGGGVLTGNSFCGGMSVTPALTFGRLLGERLQWRRNQARAAE